MDDRTTTPSPALNATGRLPDLFGGAAGPGGQDPPGPTELKYGAGRCQFLDALPQHGSTWRKTARASGPDRSNAADFDGSKTVIKKSLSNYLFDFPIISAAQIQRNMSRHTQKYISPISIAHMSAFLLPRYASVFTQKAERNRSCRISQQS